MVLPTEHESVEPVQNKVSEKFGDTRAWKIVGSDSAGNVLITDSLSWKVRFDYTGRTDGQPVFRGFAEKSAADSDNTWLIHKLTYTAINGTDFLTLREVAEGSWNGRSALF